MIFASLFLIFLSSYFLVSTLGSFLYFFAAALGLIILNIEILSLLKMISPVGIISLNFLTFFFMLLLWLKKKRVLLKINFQNILINTKGEMKNEKETYFHPHHRHNAVSVRL